MARKDIIKQDGTLNYDAIGGFKERMDGHDVSLVDNAKHRINARTLGLLPNTGLDISNTLQGIITSNTLSSNRLFLDAGRYMISKSITLKSNIDLLLDPNAEIYLMDNSPCYMLIAEGVSFQNIKWVGGIINGNDANQGVEQGTNFDTCKGMVFKNVTNLYVQGVTVKNTRGHGINHWNCDGVVFRDIQFSQSLSTLVPNGGSRRDGITGMSNNVLIDNVSGFTDDDLVAVLAGVDWAGSNTTPISVSNIEIRNVKAKKHSSGRDPWKGVAIYTSGGYSITNIKVDGVYGDFNNSLIYMGNYGKPTRGSINKPVISNIFGEATYDSGTTDFGMITVIDVTIDVLIFKNILTKLTVADNTKKYPLRTTDADITKLILDSVSHNVSIPLTDFTTILNEYTSGNHNIVEIQANNMSMIFTTTYLNGFLYYKNNVIANQTKLYANNISIPAPSFPDNGTSFQTSRAIAICGNNATIFMMNPKLPIHSAKTVCNDGDVITDPQLGELLYTGGKYYISKPLGVITATSYWSFDSTTAIVLVDGTNTSSAFRIQDLQDGSIKSNYKNGYRIKIKRIDTNASSSPYIKMTNLQVIDGSNTINLSSYQTVTLEYWNGSWYKVQ